MDVGEHRGAPAGAEALVLGIETSCDECAAAVVAGRPGAARILSNVVLSQVDLHAEYGGVVPELAARAHVETIDAVVRRALSDAGVVPADLSLVAATTGPGLLGGLLVGATFAKGLAAAAGLPFAPVNHLEAHALTPRLTEGLEFPYLVALLSGGHAQFLAAHALGRYERLGGTIDDAAGEAFDKTAKLLGLGYPGGPAVEAAARDGDPGAYDFPVPLMRREGADLSFAGLKTAVRLAAERAQPLTDRAVADVCASFQATVAQHLRRKAGVALARAGAVKALVAVGGVAANRAIGAALSEAAEAHGVAFVAPPLPLCTDNAAMIAYAALERNAAGLAHASDRVRSRWPLDEAAAPLIGGGKRGAKG